MEIKMKCKYATIILLPILLLLITASSVNALSEITVSGSLKVNETQVFTLTTDYGIDAKYYWNFGDGTTLQVDGSPQASHTYTSTGTYSVTVEVFTTLQVGSDWNISDDWAVSEGVFSTSLSVSNEAHQTWDSSMSIFWNGIRLLGVVFIILGGVALLTIAHGDSDTAIIFTAIIAIVSGAIAVLVGTLILDNLNNIIWLIAIF
jgi:hypothetical protein